jgi:uncharacterized cupin superfamily protein
MAIVNIATCELTFSQEQGRFRCRGEELGGHLGGRLIGAAVYEMEAGGTNWPYHCHHGVEEWMYVVSGAPVLRDQSGERPLSAGTLVAFASGPKGSHTVAGPGRVVIFSAGAEGWGRADASVYPDSDKLSLAGGMFRRADALAAWSEEATEAVREQAPHEPCPAVDLLAIDVAPLPVDPGDGAAASARGRGRRVGPLLGARTWAATVWELAPGESSAPYHYESRREEWALVLSGTPTVRHPDGEDTLVPCDIVGFPEGPAGAHRLSNAGPELARVLVISSPVGRPSGTFHPEQGTVVVRLSDREGFRFRLSDRIEDYWDGEPGA